jgi:hypothetical protein
MGELIDLSLVRRAYRILDHFVGDGLDMPRDDQGEACEDLIDQTVVWCSDWLERRGGRQPSAGEKRAMRRHLIACLEQHNGQSARG